MIGDFFHLVILEPMINLLVVLTHALWGSFGLALIAFTILIRVATFPLTLRQLHQTRAMQQLQPRIQEIQKKYSDPKRRQEEMLRVYREAGVNPLGCLGPMLLQLPILIGLYYAIRRTLPESPEALEALSTQLYNWSYIQRAVPLEEHFLGLDLRAFGSEGLGGLVMVILVGLTTWLQSKSTVSYATDERARAQQQMMNWMLPIMFAFFALNFPTGVSLYWIVNSIVGIGFNIAVYGIPALKIEPLFHPPSPVPAAVSPAPSERSHAVRPATPTESRTRHGPSRSKRQNRRRRT